MNSLFLHRALPFFVLPSGAALLLLAAALRWRGRVLTASALVILWGFGTPVIADAIMRSLEDRYPYRAADHCPLADAVFPLGGGILGPRDRAGMDIQWHNSAERFGRALELFALHRAPILVLSRGLPEGTGDLAEGERLKEIALSRGVPAQSIILTGRTINTAMEADALCDIAARMHWKRVLLVTSAFHMPRAMRLFRGCQAEIVPVPVDYQTSHSAALAHNRGLDRYLPQAEALSQSERALREYVGLLFYAVVPRSS